MKVNLQKKKKETFQIRQWINKPLIFTVTLQEIYYYNIYIDDNWGAIEAWMGPVVHFGEAMATMPF